MDPKEFVTNAVNQDSIVIFSKTWCSYSSNAKRLIKGLALPEGKTVKIYELDLRDDGDDIQDALRDLTDQGTVPNIFINKQWVGGSSDLTKVKAKGQLDELIAAPPPAQIQWKARPQPNAPSTSSTR